MPALRAGVLRLSMIPKNGNRHRPNLNPIEQAFATLSTLPPGRIYASD